MIVYKALSRDGKSQYQGHQWPLPPEDGEPGDWVEADRSRELVMCGWGIHGYDSMESAQREAGGYCIYEMELVDDDGEDDGLVTQAHEPGKVCGRKGRLLTMVLDEYGEAPITLADMAWQ